MALYICCWSWLQPWLVATFPWYCLSRNRLIWPALAAQLPKSPWKYKASRFWQRLSSIVIAPSTFLTFRFCPTQSWELNASSTPSTSLWSAVSLLFTHFWFRLFYAASGAISDQLIKSYWVERRPRLPATEAISHISNFTTNWSTDNSYSTSWLKPICLLTLSAFLLRISSSWSSELQPSAKPIFSKSFQPTLEPFTASSSMQL